MDSVIPSVGSNTGGLPEHSVGGQHDSFALLTLGALGVVFGDIGTSPLYAFREALGQAAGDGILGSEIIGVLSLALWALILVVTVKYVLFLMRADNDGEGGVLALMALAQRAAAKRLMLVTILGAAGAALFYGDAIITPALSVLSAVEGLRTIPALGDTVTADDIPIITVVILALLFGVQSRGTASVAKLFGPICAVWFAVLAALGLWHIFDQPAILAAFNPGFAIGFLLHHGMTGLFVLGAVFLTVTGAEALTADMGHFGRGPIQAGWFALVFPALTLNYLGQGAFALGQLEAARAAGKPFVNQDWFFLMAPEAYRISLVILATLATIIASQAVITGAYSLTRQAIQLGLLPRMRTRQTSARQAGQIYLPVINALLLVGVLILVFSFRNSSDMAAAYGIAVTGTMVVTTCLAFIITRYLWGWSLPLSLAVVAPFLFLDLFFFGANILRVIEGGWVPLVVAMAIGLLIATWIRGRKLLAEHERDETIPTAELASMLAARPPKRVPGNAVFLTANPDTTPVALLHNLKHNKVLHERNFIVAVKTANVPVVAESARRKDVPLDANFTHVTLTYGFTESPDVPRDLGLDTGIKRDRLDLMSTSYFIGRNIVRPSAGSGMPFWQDLLFIFLQRNASDPTDFFNIPPNRVVELGSQIVV